MPDNNRDALDKVLEKYVETLSVAESRFEEVRTRYKSIGEWLLRKESTLRDRNPDVYPQGSFLFGTAINPSTDNATLDVDLVCCLEYEKNNISQKDLKEGLGKELTEYAIARNMKNKPQNKKRCWMMEYEDGTRFHVDILPAIPDKDFGYRKYLLEAGVSEAFSETGICITDGTLPNYAQIDNNWLRSNPKGYALWFKDRMKVLFEKGARSLLEKRLYASVEEIPMYKIKTPLQKSVQLLKWHRDVMFERDPEGKPISCIITTLVGHAYQNEARLVDALGRIITDMDKYIEIRGNEYIVENPVRPDENFADKWKKEPVLKDNFYGWLKKLQRDLKDAAEKYTEREMIESFGAALGKRIMGKVLENSGYQLKAQSAPAILFPEVKVSPTKPWGSDGRYRI